MQYNFTHLRVYTMIQHVLLCNGSEWAANTLRQIRQVTAIQPDSLSLVSKVIQRHSNGAKVRHSTPVKRNTYNNNYIKVATNDVHRDPKKTGPITLCRIALSFHSVFSQKSTKCLRTLGAVNSNLIRMPPAVDVRSLLCNVDVKITLLRTMHVTQLKR